MRMRRLVASTAGVIMVVFATMVMAPVSASADHEYERCDSGEICFFSDFDGSGSICAWKTFDSDWQGGAVRCSWSATSNVKSIWNRRGVAVDYYKGADYDDRVGCTHSGIAGNLAGTYKLRSHKFRSSSRC